MKHPVVFIHGLWLHAESWKPWMDLFRANGYEVTAAGWLGESGSTEATRENPGTLVGYGVKEIADHIAGQLNSFEKKPILIGHSYGGLFVQNLLGRGLGVAGIAIDPAPIQGVYQVPFSALKSTLPVLKNPFNLNRVVPLTEAQFRFGFTNAIPEPEARELYAKLHIPSPGRPVFQAATATFNPNAATKVNVSNPSRGPLLLISGLADNTIPPVLVKSTLRMYRKSKAVTEYMEFAGRGHSLVIDSGWREIAEACLKWLNEKGF